MSQGNSRAPSPAKPIGIAIREDEIPLTETLQVEDPPIIVPGRRRQFGRSGMGKRAGPILVAVALVLLAALYWYLYL
jgi:hypothetical protein